VDWQDNESSADEVDSFSVSTNQQDPAGGLIRNFGGNNLHANNSNSHILSRISNNNNNLMMSNANLSMQQIVRAVNTVSGDGSNQNRLRHHTMDRGMKSFGSSSLNGSSSSGIKIKEEIPDSPPHFVQNSKLENPKNEAHHQQGQHGQYFINGYKTRDTTGHSN
jgi:hypothetical protein